VRAPPRCHRRVRSPGGRLGLPRLPTGPPLPGYLLIADRDNNRNPPRLPGQTDRLAIPPPGGLVHGQGFAAPDDAFLTPHGGSIITNEEFADTIAIVRLGPKPRISFEYGHATHRECSRIPVAPGARSTGPQR
jgi:hypothetical protein